MKNTYRLFALLLCTLILIPCLSACADSSSGAGKAEAASTTAGDEVTTKEAETTDGSYYMDQSLLETKYTGQTISIATTSTRLNTEWYAETETGDTVNDALVTRNNRVKEDLGVEFVYKDFEESGGNSRDMRTAITAQTKSGDVTYDFFAAPSYYTITYITEGLVLNLASIENNHMDMTKAYWSEKYYDNSKIAGKYFFVIGDVTSTVIEKLEVIFVNKELAETYIKDTKDLYQTVYDREWTYEKFLTIINGCGDGTNTGFYGLNIPCNSHSIDGLEAGFALDLITISDDGTITANVNSEHNIEIVEALRGLYHQNTAVKTNTTLDEFKSSNALFTMGLLEKSETFIEAGIKYSILPTPLWNSDQSDYISTSQDTYSIIGIISNVGDRAEMITAVLEDLCWRSHDTVYTALYDITYSAKYSDSSADARMFDFIYQHVDFSSGSIYSYMLSEIKNCPRYLIYNPTSVAWDVNSSIVSSLTALQKVVRVAIKDMNSKLSQIQ